MANGETCIGCMYYERHGIKRGGRSYSKCLRPGAKELAMDERFTGECGLDAKLKENV